MDLWEENLVFLKMSDGAPISPLLFNDVGYVIARIFINAKNSGLIKELVPHIIENEICSLQYADDIVVMFQDNWDMAINVKNSLYLFEEMVGLKINF
jgi:hypothetical protein